MESTKTADRARLDALVGRLRRLPRWSCTLVHQRDDKHGGWVKWDDVRNAIKVRTANASGSSAPACWPLPPEWATFIPPQAVNIKIETVSAENGGGTMTRPVWNEQWLRGLEAYVRGIVRDELSKANAGRQP